MRGVGARNVAVVLALVAITLATTESTGAQAQTCFGKPATIIATPGQPTVGTAGADVIIGTSGPDEIRGGGGADRICSKGGNDRVFGGRGDDRINLGSGNDFAKGGPGDDLIKGSKGRDEIYGNGGKDTLKGGAKADAIRGGKKADVVQGNSGPDRLWGNSGPDTLDGGTGTDECYGGSGVDTASRCEISVSVGPTAPVDGTFTGPVQAQSGLSGGDVAFEVSAAGTLVSDPMAHLFLLDFRCGGVAIASEFEFTTSWTDSAPVVGSSFTMTGPRSMQGSFDSATSASGTVSGDLILQGTICSWGPFSWTATAS